MNKRLLLFFLGCCLMLSVDAQDPIWIPVETNSTHTFFALQTDTLGFIWALAADGLYKYDGYELSKKVSLPNADSEFRSIDFPSKHFFILGTDQGLRLDYNPYSNTIIGEKNDFKGLPITAISFAVGSSATATIHYGHGLRWQSEKLDTFLHSDNLLISNEVYQTVFWKQKLILATDQGIQILSENNGAISSKTIANANGLQDIIVTKMLLADQSIWICNFEDKISKINLLDHSVQTFAFETKSKINDLALIAPDQLLVGRNDGLYLLKDGKWEKKFPKDKDFSKVNSLTLDEEANIWLSSDKTNLVKGSLLFQKLTLPFKNIQALLKDQANFFIGTKDGLYLCHEEKETLLIEGNITCLAEHNNLIWAGTFSSGLLIFNKTGKLIKKVDGWENHSGQSVLSLLPTDKEIYLSSLTGVTAYSYVLENGSISLAAPRSLNNLLGQGYTYQILKHDDRLYFATDQQGLKVLEQGGLKHFTHFKDSTVIGSIYSMIHDDQDRLWIASSEGNLAYQDNDVFIKENNIRNPKDTYTSLTKLKNGHLLMIRSGSIELFHPQENYLLSFDKTLGIANEPSFLNAFSATSEEVWFTHDKNVYLFSNLATLKSSPEVLIDKISMNFTHVENQHHFNQDENNFQFNFTGSWMTDPNKLSYRYFLEGFDEDWRLTKDRSVSYPKLPPGAYNFSVKAIKNEFFDLANEKKYAFQIKKHFYNTWLFRALVLLLSFLLFRRWRNAQQNIRRKKVALEKQQLESQLINLQSQLNPHFLFNSFNTLIGLIEENPNKGIIFTEQLTDFY